MMRDIIRLSRILPQPREKAPEGDRYDGAREPSERDPLEPLNHGRDGWHLSSGAGRI
jgi:hypothetical protein